jgi:hypothetical protein
MSLPRLETVHDLLTEVANHDDDFVGIAVNRATQLLIADGEFSADDKLTIEIIIKVYSKIDQAVTSDRELHDLARLHSSSTPVDHVMNYVQTLAARL